MGLANQLKSIRPQTIREGDTASTHDRLGKPIVGIELNMPVRSPVPYHSNCYFQMQCNLSGVLTSSAFSVADGVDQKKPWMELVPTFLNSLAA